MGDLKNLPRPLNMTIMSANIQGLCPAKGKFKLGMLKETAKSEGVGIMALTESHLNSDYHEGEITIESFTHFRADRTDGVRKGGVIVFVRTDLAPGARIVAAGSHGNIEYLVLKVAAVNLNLVCIYRPPTSDAQAFMDVISKIKCCLVKQPPSSEALFYCGDLNFPIINWSLSAIQGGTTSSQRQARALLEFFSEFFLEQYVEEPTRGNNILDLIATDDNHLILNIQVMCKSKISNHNLIIVKTTECLSDKEEHTLAKDSMFALDFWSKRIIWSELRAEFASYNWMEFLEKTDPDELYNQLCNIILKICRKKVPIKRAFNKKDIPRDRKVLMRKRGKLHKRLLTARPEADVTAITAELGHIDLQIVASHEVEITRGELKAIEKLKDDQKYFYKYAKAKSRSRCPVGPLLCNQNLVSEPNNMCEILRKQFESVFSIPLNTVDIDNLLEQPGPRCLEDIIFTEDDIVESVKRIPTQSSPGPDGIPAKLLKECIHQLKKPLYKLWRTSLDQGKVPENVKFSHVSPIFKKGDKSLPKNYRPISLTSHVGKLFERLVVKHITGYLNSMNLFNSEQHGFRTGRSCLSQLLEHQQQILASLEAGTNLDKVYLDFAKAFDKVDYGILLSKLRSIGISG